MNFKNKEIIKKIFNKKNRSLVEINKNSGISLILLIISLIILLIFIGVVIFLLMKINNSSFNESIGLPEYDNNEIIYKPLSKIESFDESIDIPKYDKYVINYSPFLAIESSTRYKFYIDLKNKEIIEIKTDYWINEKTNESNNVKKIDDATYNKLIEKIIKIERYYINKDDEEMENFNNDTYKRIVINVDKKNGIENDILNILLWELFYDN